MASKTKPSPPVEPAIATPSELQAALALSTADLDDVNDDARNADLQAQVEQLKAQLAAKEAELVRKEAAASLPDSGAGIYEIVVRHSPIPKQAKKFVCHAANEADAWAKFTAGALRAANNPKDPDRKAVKHLEQWLAEGRVAGFDRGIRKLTEDEVQAQALAVR